MKRRATLKDIANALNISVTTVSRALNDKDDISPQTKKAVLDVAKMLEYKPNAIAVSLRKNVATKIIGVILPSVNHYFFSTILKGIMSSAHMSDYMVMIGESNHDYEKEKLLIEQFADHLVSGVIYAPSRNPDAIQNATLLKRRGLPAIIIDRKFDDFNGSYLQHDNFTGAHAAVSHLIAQGYQKIAHIRGDESCSISNERYKGYLKALRDHQLVPDQSLVQCCIHVNKEDGYKITQNMFEQGSVHPDAIFTVTDRVAAGVYEYAMAHNISIPQELGVVGYSNSDIAQNLYPKLSTVEQNGQEMGETAFNFLLDQLSNQNSVYQKTFSTKLIIRDSSILKNQRA